MSRKQPDRKRLALDKRTLRALTDDGLARAVGGTRTRPTVKGYTLTCI